VEQTNQPGLPFRVQTAAAIQLVGRLIC
jgi:hypothetical protein